MNELSFNDLPYLPTEKGEIEQISSNLGPFSPNNISAGPDNGFNNCAARLFAWYNRHKTTEVATINLSSARRSSGSYTLVNLCGHGYPGFLETGSGQKGQGDPKTNFITNSNKIYWENKFQRLRTLKEPLLRIYSCHTGGGQAGADLLFALALATQKEVKARTGLTFCRRKPGDIGFRFEKGSAWQIATPTNKPAPIEPPTPPLTSNGGHTEVEIFLNKKTITIPFSSVKSITIDSYKIEDGSIRSRTLIKKEVAPAMVTLFGTTPYALPGSIAAMITAELKIIVDLMGQDEVLEYEIYNNRLIVNKCNKSAHYTHLNVTDFY